MNKKEIISIEHEVLHILFTKSRMIATKTGIEETGYIQINKEIILSPMHFGAILALINFPNKFQRKHGGDIDFFTNLNPTDKEIDANGIITYTQHQIADAIDVLSFNDEIIDKLENFNNGLYKRTIQLKPKGKIAYTTKYYIKKKEKELLDLRLLNSNINTNKLMRWFNFFIAVSAIALTINIVHDWVTNNEKSTILNMQIDSLKKEQLNLQDSIQLHQSMRGQPQTLKNMEDTLKKEMKAK